MLKSILTTLPLVFIIGCATGDSNGEKKNKTTHLGQDQIAKDEYSTNAIQLTKHVEKDYLKFGTSNGEIYIFDKIKDPAYSSFEFYQYPLINKHEVLVYQTKNLSGFQVMASYTVADINTFIQDHNTQINQKLNQLGLDFKDIETTTHITANISGTTIVKSLKSKSDLMDVNEIRSSLMTMIHPNQRALIPDPKDISSRGKRFKLISTYESVGSFGYVRHSIISASIWDKSSTKKNINLVKNMDTLLYPQNTIHNN